LQAGRTGGEADGLAGDELGRGQEDLALLVRDVGVLLLLLRLGVLLGVL
jgi:hypothetical protein